MIRYYVALVAALYVFDIYTYGQPTTAAVYIDEPMITSNSPEISWHGQTLALGVIGFGIGKTIDAVAEEIPYIINPRNK